MKTQSLLGPGGRVSFASVTIDQGGTLDIYNTADKTTNYERLRASFTSNRAEVGTFYAGTGTSRQMRVGAGTSSVLTSYLGFYPQQFPFIEAVLPNTGSSGVLAELFKGTFTGSAGTQTIASIQPTINQSGTAGYTALDINPTETATGGGTKLLQRWAVGGTEVARMNNFGVLYSNFLSAITNIGLAASIGAANDVTLNRDAADTLALRSGPNAQTIRVYNTYTDASNYERGVFGWSGTTLQIGTFNAGTGTSKSLTFYTSAAARWSIGATSGHFLADLDNSYDIGASGANRPRNGYFGGALFVSGAIRGSSFLSIADGIAAPGADVGSARIYVDTADGDLKIIFGDGTVKTIVTDT